MIKDFKSFNESIEDNNIIQIVMGDSDLIFEHFILDNEEDIQYSIDNNGKFKLRSILFPEEWDELVDYENTYAIIEEGQLFINVYGMPSHIKVDKVIDYTRKVIESYLTREYGEFFESEPGNPICMSVIYNGNNITL